MEIRSLMTKLSSLCNGLNAIWIWIVAIISILAVLFVAIWMIYSNSKVPGSFPLIQYSALRQEVIKTKIEGSSSYFNFAIALLGFIWVVYVVEKDKLVKLKDLPGVMMFIASNVLIGLSAWCYMIWKGRLINACWDIPFQENKLPDVLYTHFDSLNYAQEVSFILAVLVIAILVITTRVRISQNGRSK